MCKVSSITGSICNDETSEYYRDSPEIARRKKQYQILIQKANSVPINRIFKYYGLPLNEFNKKTSCPFLSHKGGKERTSSFYYYPDTNSFWCFGCKVGTTCVDFIAEYHNISRNDAALKILESFSNDIDGEFIVNKSNFFEKLEIMLEFSNLVKDFRRSYADERSFNFIENVCSIFDSMNMKHSLNNEALKFLVNQLKEKINSYELSDL